jgi:hypothetical protein
MKFKVTYYDIETDSSVVKDCCEINYDGKGNFLFTPVDNPVKIYKSITINRPEVSIYQSEGKIRIVVDGFQYIKNYGYDKTITKIENVNDE